MLTPIRGLTTTHHNESRSSNLTVKISQSFKRPLSHLFCNPVDVKYINELDYHDLTITAPRPIFNDAAVETETER